MNWEQGITKMLKLFTAFSLMLILSLFPPGQSTIENPEKPLNPKAGRIVKLNEILRIDDIGDPYYFRFPRNLRVDSNGSIFVQDDKQVLRFSPEGKFIRNYIKTGQGPGEINMLDNFFILEDALFISSLMPNKIVWIDYEGRLLKENHLNALKYNSNFFHYFKDQYYFFNLEMENIQKKRGIIDLPRHFFRVSSEGKDVKKFISFSTKHYPIKREEMLVGLSELVAIIIAPYKKRYLYILD